MDGKINDTCVRRSDDPETLDITNCDISDWECFDGIMDITNVRIKLINVFLSTWCPKKMWQ